jgi:hypothetical protein
LQAKQAIDLRETVGWPIQKVYDGAHEQHHRIPTPGITSGTQVACTSASSSDDQMPGENGEGGIRTLDGV